MARLVPRKRRRLDLGTYVAPEERDIPLEDLVEEGVLIAASAVRLTVKNFIILSSVRDHEDYSPEKFVAAARADLELLADEKDADSARLTKLQAVASTRGGRAQHHDDYRMRDVTALARREAVSRGLAARLRELSLDEEYAAALVEAAHASAWGEIEQSIAAKLARTVVDDADYRNGRDGRLLDLLGDLADLDRQRS
jgi:hypothetical protein